MFSNTIERIQREIQNLNEEVVQFTSTDEVTKRIRVLKFRECDLVRNLTIAKDNKLELLTNCSNVFCSKKWFYIIFNDTGERVYRKGLRGEWL